MPITTSILEHDVLGPIFKQALLEGLLEGRREGELTMLRLPIAKRFDTLPGWANEKLAALVLSALEDVNERLLDATSMEELLK